MLSQCSEIVTEINVFGYFSTTTDWNHSRFSALATLYSILPEMRQAKPGRFQKKVSQKRFRLNFLHYRNSTEKQVFSLKTSYFTVPRCSGKFIYQLVL